MVLQGNNNTFKFFSQLYCYIVVHQTLQFYIFTPFFLYNKVISDKLI